MFSLTAAALLFLSTTSATPLYGTESKVSYAPNSDWYSTNLAHGAAPSNAYYCFHGDVNNYPSMDKWVSFSDMWQINRGMILQSNSHDQARDMYFSIKNVAVQANVDARVILATIMQESSGNPRAKCTGNKNCGLMQAPSGSTTFDPLSPSASIWQMIEDGVLGTPEGPGLVQYLTNDPIYAYTNNKWALNPFAAARCYNSGSISSSGNLDVAVYGKKSYVNDIANRLLGWNGADAAAFQAQCGLGA